MNFSLYQLACSIEPPPQTLPVSPATLLSMAGSVIDLLIEQQISATIWVKLSPGEIWLSEIQRYHQQVGVSHTIYNCSGKLQHPVNIPRTDATTGKGESANASAPMVSVQLAPTSQLRREYFLLVLSPQFCSLILARRPAVSRQAGTRQKAANVLERATLSDTAKKRTQPRQLAVCSFEGRVIQRVLDGIRQALLFQPTLTRPDAPDSELLAWDGFICPPVPDPVLLEQLLAKQVRCQEEIWRNATTNRAAAALQLQNQELLNNLRLKDEFLSNLCQELRTPLTNMKTALSLLNSPQLKPTQRQRYLQLLNTECDRQKSLIAGFLDLVQLGRVTEQTALQPIRLSDIVPGVVAPTSL